MVIAWAWQIWMGVMAGSRRDSRMGSVRVGDVLNGVVDCTARLLGFCGRGVRVGIV